MSSWLLPYILMIVPIFVVLYKIFGSSKNTSTNKRLIDSNDIDVPSYKRQRLQNDLSAFDISSSNNYTTPTQKIKSSRILEKEDTSDLFEFKISTNFDDEVKSNNQIKGKWINPSEVIQISSFKISKGFFYYGGQLKAINGYETDASLIDGSLSINYSISADIDDLGYWPKYNSLSKHVRGRYLNWLSGERNDLDIPIGYIFLYFYGIERRILVDYQKKQVSDDECFELYNEVVRLRKIYGSNKSFYSYATNLIEYLSIVVPHIIKIDDSEIEHSIYSQLFKYRLAIAVKENSPISPQLALIWIKSNPNYKLKTPALRCKNEFDALFIKEYQKKFDKGMILKPNKTKLIINYYPASSTLQGIELEDLNLPDISFKESFETLSKYISYSMAGDRELKASHESKGFKHYCFGGLFPIEKENVYKKGSSYSFIIRSLDERLIVYFRLLFKAAINSFLCFIINSEFSCELNHVSIRT